MLAFLRGFSPSGGSWSRPPALPGRGCPFSRAYCFLRFGKVLSWAESPSLRRNERGDQIFARIFLFARLPVVPGRRQPQASPCGFMGLGAPRLGLGVLQCAGVWVPYLLGLIALCPARQFWVALRWADRSGASPSGFLARGATQNPRGNKPGSGASLNHYQPGALRVIEV